LADEPARREWKSLRARAAILEGSFDAAIEDLTYVLDESHSADEFFHIGLAHVLRADAEHRNTDYALALDFMLRSGRLNAKRPELWFNLGLLYERVWMLDESVAAWQQHLAIEPEAGWRTEARLRLQEVEAKRSSRAAAIQGIPSDPKAYLHSPSSDDALEAVHQTFWIRWLPASMSDADSRAAAERFAGLWRERFGDTLPSRALAEANQWNLEALLRSAGAVIDDNVHGRNDQVLDRIEALLANLEASGQHAFAQRLGVEWAYSIRRSTRHTHCLEVTSRLRSRIAGRPYHWLRIRNELEHSICQGRDGGLGPARAQREEAAHQARRIGLKALALQAEQLVTSIDSLSGNSALVWDNAPKALEVYWSSPVAEARAQQSLYNLAEAARTMELKELAAAAQSSAVQATKRWDNPQLEALNRVYLASLLTEAGRSAESSAELEKATELFERLGEGKTVMNLRLDGKIRRAESAVAAGLPKDALSELEALSSIPGFSSRQDQLRLHQTEGIALAATGDWQRASDRFRKAISFADGLVQSFAQPQSRIAAAEKALESRRRLAELALTRNRDVSSALLIWDERSGGPPPPSRDGWSRVDAILTYVALPSSIAAFVRTPNGVTGRILEAPRKTVDSQIKQFQRLCASPASDVRLLREHGRLLFDELMAPIAANLDAKRIAIEADQTLSGLTFAALVEPDQHFWGERHEIVALSSVQDLALGASMLGSNLDALVIAAPTAGPGSRLPVLTDANREALDVARRFRGGVMISGDAAMRDADLTTRMASSSVVHFSGHGWSNGGDAGLILGASQSGDSRYLTASDLGKIDWGRCQLAVLAACLTAAGESRGPVNPRSLVRSLLAAGAARVVASRWSVDSASTAQWMSHFYDALLNGRTPSGAVHAASGRIKAMPGWEHPYYWAAFDLFGAP
jgi:CHAT domain-containing protein